jgi:hypothetical protein
MEQASVLPMNHTSPALLFLLEPEKKIPNFFERVKDQKWRTCF